MNKTIEAQRKFIKCIACGSLRTMNGEDIANKVNLLEDENARLREALAVYADPEYWRATQGDDEEYLFIESLGQKAYIQGKIARAALEKK